jgi:Ni,Fe-hydrogenase I large subunit
MTAKRVVIDPLNRIEGDMAVELTVDNNTITDAKSLGFVYRGLENIFIGQDPYDAARMSQRTCGVCPVSHGTAGAMAIEKTVDFKIPRNAQLVRDIVLCANTTVSHATHFYFMWGPDLVDKHYKDKKLYPEIKKRFDPLNAPHIKDILTEARIPLHSVVATFGGKFPHPMHCVPGGVCSIPKYIELIKINTMLNEVKAFLEKEVLNGIPIEDWSKVKSTKEVVNLLSNEKFANSDVGLFIRYAMEIGLDKYNEGTYNNFLSYGLGVNADGSWMFKPGYYENGSVHKMDQSHVSEDTSFSYYETERQWRHPNIGVTKPVPKKQGAYTWMKAARYFGNVAEVGPLARQMVNGEPLITDLVKNFGVNTFTRTIARIQEITIMLPKIIEWVDEIDLGKPFIHPFPHHIESGSGYGNVEAARGALGHWINIDNDKVSSYQIITPTTWNGSPEDSKGQRGPIEKALTGLKIGSKDGVIEAAHVVRSFDPCISCSIHAVGSKKKAIIEPSR